MSTVFILGAGASHGDDLHESPGPRNERRTPPPVLNGFFNRDFWTRLGYGGAEPEAGNARRITPDQDFPDAFDYVRRIFSLPDEPGTGAWVTLSIEDVLTFVELEREFRPPESDAGARLLLIRNQLIRFISRMIALCTFSSHGLHSRHLVRTLAREDSVITFNWDLLLDQEFLGSDVRPQHYRQFQRQAIGITPELQLFEQDQEGIFLKLHGSLNWFQCTNPKCPAHSNVEFWDQVQDCLNVAAGIHTKNTRCQRCDSDMLPLIVPPVLRKPINDNWVIRSAWGLARNRLQSASRVAIVGFSGAPTDFYAGWLLRSTLALRDDVRVYVVDPQCADDHEGHADFDTRMVKMLRQYDSTFRTFSQIGELLEVINPERHREAQD